MHHDKCNIGNAAGGRNLLDHDKRERDCERSNDNIDPSRSHLNKDYSARSMSAGDAWEYACERAQACSARKLRDNTVVMSQDLIHLPKNWHELYPDRDPSEFFEKVALPFCRERWGGGEGYPNEISAVVHYDETLKRGQEGMPHLHYKSVPVTEDGRLSHKDIYNRASMRELHPELSRFAEDRGYPGLDIYDETRAKVRERALTMPEYKDAQREIDEVRERLESLRQSERELAERNRELERLRDEARVEVERAEGRCEEASERVEGLERSRGETVSRIAEVSDARAESHGRCEELKKERDGLGERVDDLERRRGEAAERVRGSRQVRDWFAYRIERLEAARDMLAARARDIVSRFQQALDHVDRLLTKSDEAFDRADDPRLSSREQADLMDRGNALNERGWEIEEALERKFATLSHEDAEHLRGGLRGWVWRDQRWNWEAEREFQREERGRDDSGRSMLDRAIDDARAAYEDTRSISRDDSYESRDYGRDDYWGR